MSTASYPLPSFFVLVAILLAALPTAHAETKGVGFSLNKRSDYMQVVQRGKSFEFKVEHWDKPTDKTTVISKFFAQPVEAGQNPERFTLVHGGGGSEVRVKVLRLLAYFPGPVPETMHNKGDWSVTLSGRGPAFEKLRRYVVDHRWETDWRGKGDLTFYGSTFSSSN